LAERRNLILIGGALPRRRYELKARSNSRLVCFQVPFTDSAFLNESKKPLFDAYDGKRKTTAWQFKN
jgi:hypothetical protein